GHFAGEGTLVFEVHVLRPQRDGCARQGLRHGRNKHRGWGNHDVAIASERVRITIDVPPQPGEQRTRLKRGQIHLPVAGYQYPAHRGLSLLQLSSAFTPGSTRPSRYSSVAPPPVEMCAKRLAHGACARAAAVSPPPMMDLTPSVLASASPTARVPCANSGSSKNPSGPFQMTVLARAISLLNCSMVVGPISSPIRSPGISVTVRIRAPAWGAEATT